MKIILQITIILLVLLLFSNTVCAYEKHEPILIENIHATADNPYIVEGYEISSDTSNCIEVRNSENIIIRNNYVHDCTWSEDPARPYSHDEGFAIIVGDSKDVTVKENVVEDNKLGVVSYRSQRFKLLNNQISRTKVWSSVRLERCNNSEVAYNNLKDNGIPEWFWIPGERIIGIYIVRSNDIDVHDNTVIRSSSDGISVGGQIDGGGLTTEESDWKGTANNIRIYNNLILDNYEIGMWLVRARNLEIFNNTIRSHVGIQLDFDVDDSNIYNNKLVGWPSGISLGVSHNNHIYNNKYYSVLGDEFHTGSGDGINANEGDKIKLKWAGIEYSPSSGNLIENNSAFKIGGALANIMNDKMEWLDKEDIFKEQGWFACETSEGVVDEECVARENAKGFAGISSDFMVFNPLYPNPDGFVVENDFNAFSDKDKSINKESANANNQSVCEECNYFMEKVYAGLFLITLISLVLVIILYFKKK